MRCLSPFNLNCVKHVVVSFSLTAFATSGAIGQAAEVDKALVNESGVPIQMFSEAGSPQSESQHLGRRAERKQKKGKRSRRSQRKGSRRGAY